MLRIQPDEGISLSFDAKVPGPLERLETVTMDFSYSEHFKQEPTTGYETLLFDAMAGDQTLFHRMDMVEAGWQIVEPILEALGADTRRRCRRIEPGAWGPAEADLLLERDDRRWRSSPSKLTPADSRRRPRERIASLLARRLSASRHARHLSHRRTDARDDSTSCSRDPSHPWRGDIDWNRACTCSGATTRTCHPTTPTATSAWPTARSSCPRADSAHATSTACGASCPTPRRRRVEYERVLKRFERAGAPRFDVMLLGLGEDAHIASIFPGSPLLAPQNDPAPRDDQPEADERGVWRRLSGCRRCSLAHHADAARLARCRRHAGADRRRRESGAADARSHAHAAAVRRR